MDYYAYWNGATMAQFFQYVAAIVGSNDFNGLLKALGIIGMLVATCGAAFRMQGMEVGKWIFALALFQSLLLVPKVTVRVWDVRAGTSVNVSNVPIGLGVFASELSHIGKYLTDTYETLFTTPGDVSKFSKFGLAGPQRFARAAARAMAATPDTKLTLDAFINQCVIPEVADYPSKVQTIRDSTQLWALITNATAPTFVNPARLVTLPIDAVTVTCTGAVAYLNARMTADATALLKAVGVNAMPDQLGSATDLDNTNLAATVSAAIGASDTILTGASRAAQDILKDAVMFNQLKVAAGDVSDGPMTSWAVSQANMASEINYSTMARIAETALPNLRSGIEGVIIAVFPIMILVVVLTGHNGGMALKSYIFMAAWIQLWPPLYAVVNSLAMARDGSAYPTAVAALGGTTPAAMAWIAEMGASSQSTAGMFALSVPLIALAIIKGGEQAFSSMASSVLSPATSAGQGQGAALASGNVSAGNLNWGNTTTGNSSRNNVSEDGMSLGQRNYGPTFNGGASMTSTRWSSDQKPGHEDKGPGGTLRFNPDGSLAGSTQMGFGGTTQYQESLAQVNQAQAAYSGATSRTAATTQSLNESNAALTTTTVAGLRNAAVAASTGTAAQRQAAFGTIVGALDSLKNGSNDQMVESAKKDVATQFGGNLSLNIPGSKDPKTGDRNWSPVSGGAKIGGDQKNSAGTSANTTTSAGSEAATSRNLQATIGDTVTKLASISPSASTVLSTTVSGAQTTNATAAKNQSAAVQEQESAARALTQAKQASVTATSANPDASRSQLATPGQQAALLAGQTVSQPNAAAPVLAAIAAGSTNMADPANGGGSLPSKEDVKQRGEADMAALKTEGAAAVAAEAGVGKRAANRQGKGAPDHAAVFSDAKGKIAESQTRAGSPEPGANLKEGTHAELGQKADASAAAAKLPKALNRATTDTPNSSILPGEKKLTAGEMQQAIAATGVLNNNPKAQEAAIRLAEGNYPNTAQGQAQRTHDSAVIYSLGASAIKTLEVQNERKKDPVRNPQGGRTAPGRGG